MFKDPGALWGMHVLALESASHAVLFPSDTKKIYRAQESALKRDPLLFICLPYQGNPPYLSQGFYSCTNIMTEKQVGEERVFSAYTSTQLSYWISVRTISNVYVIGAMSPSP